MDNEFDKANCTCNHDEIIQLRAKLGLKISKMLKSFGAISEDGENKFSNYGYISSNKMVGILRENLELNQLAIIPEVIKYEERYTVDSKDKSWIRTIVEMNFEIIDTETGFSMTKKFFGADQDTGGKSFGQAVTEATKRFYFKLFQVSSTDEKDPDGKTTETPQGQSKNQQKKSEPAQSIPDDQWMDFYSNWNSKRYGDFVYHNNVKCKLNKQQIEYLEKHPKPAK